MKALALFSGGLDSALAIKLVKEQGIEVIALNFASHFFGGTNQRSELMAKELGVRLEYIDFKELHRELVDNPPSGYGKHMNPCIDCHALMMKKAGELLEKYGASFIITGEVLGERPMSQSFGALKRVEKLSGMIGLVVRPLSAKLLPITYVEEQGWLDREKLLDVQGRTRRRQYELVAKYNIKTFPTPGGGCLLTDKSYSKKLKILQDDGEFKNTLMFDLIKYGRFFRFDKGRYLIVGRREDENEKLEGFKERGSFHIDAAETFGPVIIGVGELKEEEIIFAKELYSRYSKIKGIGVASIAVNGKTENFEIKDNEKFEENLLKFQVL